MCRGGKNLNMDKFKEIRPIVLGIVKKDNKIFVLEERSEGI